MGAAQLDVGLVIRDSVSGKFQGYGIGGEMYQMELIGYNYTSSHIRVTGQLLVGLLPRTLPTNRSSGSSITIAVRLG